MTDQLAKGDRVIVVNADHPAHNQTGTIVIDDGTDMPFYVDFDNGDDGDWFRKGEVAPAAYRPIAPGEHVPEGADVFIPAGLASHVGRTDGKRGAHTTFAEIDPDGDLPVMLSTPTSANQMMWFRATACYINAPEFAPGGVIDGPHAEEVPEPGQPIRVLRRHVITLTQPVSPADLGRAAGALEPGMRVSVHTYPDRMEVVGTDPEDDRG